MGISYIDIAKSDRSWVDRLIIEGKARRDFNPAVIYCQQAAEKYLKGYIDDYLNINGVYDKQLKSHNFRVLAGIVNEKTGIAINLRDAKYLGDFYFDTRYPGDNYMQITDITVAEECRDICDEIIRKLECLIEQEKFGISADSGIGERISQEDFK